MRRRTLKEIKEEIISKMQNGTHVISTKTVYRWLRQDTGEAVVSGLKYNKLK